MEIFASVRRKWKGEPKHFLFEDRVGVNKCLEDVCKSIQQQGRHGVRPKKEKCAHKDTQLTQKVRDTTLGCTDTGDLSTQLLNKVALVYVSLGEAHAFGVPLFSDFWEEGSE